MKILIFVQARMNSKRLPGKVLLEIEKKSILEHVCINLKKSKFKFKIVVLTSKNKKDDKIISVCKRNKISFFRGSLDNVYKRFIDALKSFQCDAFVRVCADSPLINPEIMDKVIKKYKTKKFDIVTNCFPKSYPKGLSIEIVNTKIFQENFKNIKNKSFSEHITKYFYINKNKFKIFNIKSKKKKKYNSLAVDNLNDYKFIKREFNNICI